MRIRFGSVVLCAVVGACLSSGALAQRQFEDWPVKHYLPRSPYPTVALAVGDVDGDSDLDLVVGTFPQHRLYLNGGNGSFTDVTAAQMPGSGWSARGVAMGDVDGDSDLDLVFANANRQNQLYLNDGSGRFVDATAARMPADADTTWGMTLVDCEGDGDLDIVFANNGQQNRLYLNDGTGTFTNVTEGRLPAEADLSTAVAAGDVDGDSDLDLVICNYSGRTDRLYLNDGAGTFSDVTATQMPRLLYTSFGLAMTDVDRDSDLDLVIAQAGAGTQTRLFLNDGAGTFTDATAARLPTRPGGSSVVVAGDVDGDSDVDLLLDGSVSNRLYLNDGTGTFTETALTGVGAALAATALGDLDGDSDLDLVVGNRTESRLYFNDGSGAFTEPSGARMPIDSNDTHGLGIGDMDGDGDQDIVFGNYFEQNTLYLNDGTGAFTDETATRMPRLFHAALGLAVGDMDGDADLDIVVANAGVQPSGGVDLQNRLYLNDGTGRFFDATAGRMPADQDSSTSVALGDVDGDGDLDIVFGNYASSIGNNRQNKLYINNGGRFVDATTKRLPIERNDTLALVLADVDGDTDLDLVCANTTPRSQNRLFFNDGTGRFTNVTESRMPVDADVTNELALADVDGDGDLDMVTANSSAQDRLYLNDGSGTFTDATAGRMPVATLGTTSVALADADGDGDVDIALGTWMGSASQTRLYLNDGTGTFADATAARLPTDSELTSRLALADLDGDADRDLVVANHFGPNRMYTNLHRQLTAPVLASVSKNYDIQLHAKPGYGSSAHVGAALLGLALAPTPLSLPPLGSFYLAPAPLLPLQLVSIPPQTGMGTTSFGIPATPSLAGTDLFFQGLVLNLAVAADVHLTGYVVDVILP